jgi:uncharacterized protein YcnI
MLLSPSVAMAHVVVTPDEVGIGQHETFQVNVPNEKNSDVTELRLQLPSGLEEVSPTVKPGWQVAATKTTIIWSRGTIPGGFNDVFTFRAQAPAQVTELNWKAYQTYADGTTVSWDQKPDGNDDDNSASGPYSVTKVVDDLAASSAKDDDSGNNNLALILAIVALVFSLAAFQQRRSVKK